MASLLTLYLFPDLLLSDFSCTCGGGDRSKCLKACSIVDGTSLNGDCACGSTNCNAETGHYCFALLNTCAKMKFAPACINTDGSFSNRKTCTCGSSVCDATKGLFCDASSSDCSKRKPGTEPGDSSCTGCENLLGTKSGTAWMGTYMSCDDWEKEKESDPNYCAEYGTDDEEGEGKANDKW